MSDRLILDECRLSPDKLPSARGNLAPQVDHRAFHARLAEPLVIDLDLASSLEQRPRFPQTDTLFLEIISQSQRSAPEPRLECCVTLSNCAEGTHRFSIGGPQPIVGLAIPLGSISRPDVQVRVETTSVDLVETSGPTISVSLFLFNRTALHDEIERRITWLFGVARSGTTWVTEICWQIDRVFGLEENGIARMFGVPCWEPERLFAGAEHFYRDAVFTPEALVDGGVTVDRRLKPFQRQAVWFHEPIQGIYHKRNADLFKAGLRTMAIELVLREWGVSGYDVIVLKSPNDSQIADFIGLWMPNSRILAVHRDGRDVMRSRFSPFASPQLAATSDLALRRYAVAWYSHIWNYSVDVIGQAIELHDPRKTLVLRYEDLRRDTKAGIKRLSAFFGRPLRGGLTTERLAEMVTIENQPAETRGPSEARQDGRIGGYRSQFSAEEIELMNTIMGRNLAALGYDI